MTKPQRLRPGDTVAVVSPSWGGPSVFPHVFDLGLRNLRELFGLNIKEFSTARMPNDLLYLSPVVRARDINQAFADPEVKAIIASIGGDDSVRILPHLDLDLIKANPKILMGYSDTTTLNTYLNWNGLVTFNGPSIMAGFAQMRHLDPAFVEHVRGVLFDAEAVELLPYPQWVNAFKDWSDPDYDGETEPPQHNEGWHWLQGSGMVVGELFGGCVEVLEFLKGTEFWPDIDFWNDRILFFETSEDKPTPDQVKYMLRNYGSMGVFDRVSAILFGRPRSYTNEDVRRLEENIVKVVGTEFGRTRLPIVSNLDFGHTDPQWIMPLGIPLFIDCNAGVIRYVEPAVA